MTRVTLSTIVDGTAHPILYRDCRHPVIAAECEREFIALGEKAGVEVMG